MRPAAELDPAIIVIVGITGDLSQRYLLPALYNLTKKGLLNPATRIVGVTRGDTTTEQLYQKVETLIDDCDSQALESLRRHTEMFKMDLDNAQHYTQLLQRLNTLEDEVGMCLNRLYYLSIPPNAYPPVIKLLGEQGLNQSCQHGKAATRLMVEKPFGFDLQSGQDLIEETAKYFREEQTFRIDHYMAKQTVQNILKSRFEGKDSEAAWNKDNVTSISIFAKEKIGIEGRAVFYDSLGALRDFIQNHLTQIMGVATMDMPAQLDSKSIHAQKEAVLAQVEVVPTDQINQRVIRGQYDGYREEVQNPQSTTETFASVTVYIDNERWQGVPITLMTGKALDERKAAMVAKLRDGGEIEYRIQPEIHPNPDAPTNAYETVFSHAINGDQSLFASSQEIISSWRVLQPVLDAWSKSSDDLIIYPRGTAGPSGGGFN